MLVCALLAAPPGSAGRVGQIAGACTVLAAVLAAWLGDIPMWLVHGTSAVFLTGSIATVARGAMAALQDEGVHVRVVAAALAIYLLTGCSSRRSSARSRAARPTRTSRAAPTLARATGSTTRSRSSRRRAFGTSRLPWPRAGARRRRDADRPDLPGDRRRAPHRQPPRPHEQRPVLAPARRRSTRHGAPHAARRTPHAEAARRRRVPCPV